MMKGRFRTMEDFATPVVEPQWLVNNLDAEDLVILDGSWRLNGGASAAKAAYDEAHIPGAVFFDVDEISDRSSPLPHMLPTPENFAEAVSALGVSNNDAVVIYDEAGLFSAPRVWWTFRAMGHDRVSVLNGGLPMWRAIGAPVTGAVRNRTRQNYQTNFKSSLVSAAADVQNASNSALILDARPSARFRGEANEPRAGLRSGAMPNAGNTPSAGFLSEDGAIKSATELKAVFDAVGLDDQSVIATCGSGVTAASICLALEIIGHRDWSLYDGSWAEWGREENDATLFPVVARSEGDA
ncbi:MAG: 3-mercaptopyruvate sulfurtransferase [Pseudomonadota bacterium]